MPYKIIFAGSPELAVPTLNALVQSEHEILAVYTQPDRRGGRGRREFIKSPVKLAAEQHDLIIEQPESLKELSAQEKLFSYGADVFIVLGYGIILPENVLNNFSLGGINPHVSLLPKWRGAAPIQRAIEAGDSETGVSIMQMDKGVDSGPVFLQASTPIDINDSSADVHERLAAISANALIDVLTQIENGTAVKTPQDESFATYAKKITKSEGEIIWSDPALMIHNKIRAFNPWPIAFCDWFDESLRIWKSEYLVQASDLKPGTIVNIEKNAIDIACGENILRLLEVQPAGKKCIGISDFSNSRKDKLIVGSCFGSN